MNNIFILKDEEGDWITIYRNNKIVYENHSIDPTELLDILNIEYKIKWINFEKEFESNAPNYISDSWFDNLDNIYEKEQE